mmetsp:Transcript_2246/g.5786  ORF Transcript_2246/g.5786 Transcript_2246/m.5786 type:complete len:224 (-) Transcript_2246:373-1044(-)
MSVRATLPRPVSEARAEGARCRCRSLARSRSSGFQADRRQATDKTATLSRLAPLGTSEWNHQVHLHTHTEGASTRRDPLQPGKIRRLNAHGARSLPDNPDVPRRWQSVCTHQGRVDRLEGHRGLDASNLPRAILSVELHRHLDSIIAPLLPRQPRKVRSGQQDHGTMNDLWHRCERANRVSVAMYFGNTLDVTKAALVVEQQRPARQLATQRLHRLETSTSDL